MPMRLGSEINVLEQERKRSIVIRWVCRIRILFARSRAKIRD